VLRPVRPKIVHVIGAGLSAAVDLARRGVVVALHEATEQAGGRCRSYADMKLGMDIDNGNHLILSGNRATLSYLDHLGARDSLTAAPSASFPFVDLKTQERWTLRANDGPIPWWICVASRRVPGAPLYQYLRLAWLLRAGAEVSIGETIPCSGPLYERLLEPFLLAALNIDPKDGSAALAAGVIRETLAAGGRHYHPLIARGGLSKSLIDPALRYISAQGGSMTFGRRLRRVTFNAHRATALDFGGEALSLADGEAVILAVPPQVATAAVPNISAPTEFRAIVNVHYSTAPPAGLQPMTGVINGLAQWVFAFPDRISVTISAADHLLNRPREEIARNVWRDVAAACDVTGPMPTWQILSERRATFAASPEQDAKRPAARTSWCNLALAGDWTQTGLPATIEGAIRSGVSAARVLAPI